jgi:CheY-like chemotaxis protein
MRTLLLADDSVTIQRVIELTFADEDVRVVSVGDGRRALQWLERESPDIVLADVGLPGVDGYALTTWIRQSSRLRRTPVLLMAGAFEPVDEAQSRQVGCDGVLVKPFEPHELVSRVRGLIEDFGTDRQSSEPPPDDEQARGWRPVELDPAQVVARFPSAPRPQAAAMAVAAPVVQAASAASAERAPEPAWDQIPAAAGERREPPLPPRVALANAFSALLAAEQATAAAPPAPVLSDAVVEAAVRKALVRMTDNIVRRIVVETAERLIREEIEKIKSASE